LGNLKVGDQVITTGGVYGKITGMRENIITLEISEKVRVKVNRANISGVVKSDVAKTE
jgi:preprotein translocase subunit YajC